MKIIITENQLFLIRRLQQFVDLVEDQIDGYERNEDGAWWCKYNTPDSFLENFRDRCIEEFVNNNWEFFHDNSENGGSNMDISLLYNIVDQDYGNYIKNLFVRKCNYYRY
jgi:hypothetical protein